MDIGLLDIGSALLERDIWVLSADFDVSFDDTERLTRSQHILQTSWWSALRIVRCLKLSSPEEWSFRHQKHPSRRSKYRA